MATFDAEGTVEKGQTITSDIIQANPDIKAIFSINDQAGMGAYAALTTAGKEVYVYGVDGAPEAKKVIAKDNSIYRMTAAQSPITIGKECYKAAKTLIAGEKPEEFEVDVPQDRQSSFEPQVLPKRQKDISSIDDKIIAMYAKGMTTRQISETIEDIYGFEVSEGMVSDITDKLLPKIEEWQNRPLSPVYPIVFIDAVHFSVRDDGVIRKLAAYVVLGINEDGMKEVLSIVVGENESSKYWLSVLNSLKNRGVQDILILCSDGLTGIKDAISTAFPKTEQQRCIVHMVRNTLKYVANKDMKSFAKDLKTIYTAASEEAARKQLETVTKKWSGQYPSAMNRWHDNWDAISPIFKFSKDVRTCLLYTSPSPRD